MGQANSVAVFMTCQSMPVCESRFQGEVQIVTNSVLFALICRALGIASGKPNDSASPRSLVPRKSAIVDVMLVADQNIREVVLGGVV